MIHRSISIDCAEHNQNFFMRIVYFFLGFTLGAFAYELLQHSLIFLLTIVDDDNATRPRQHSFLAAFMQHQHHHHHHESTTATSSSVMRNALQAFSSGTAWKAQMNSQKQQPEDNAQNPDKAGEAGKACGSRTRSCGNFMAHMADGELALLGRDVKPATGRHQSKRNANSTRLAN